MLLDSVSLVGGFLFGVEFFVCQLFVRLLGLLRNLHIFGKKYLIAYIHGRRILPWLGFFFRVRISPSIGGRHSIAVYLFTDVASATSLVFNFFVRISRCVTLDF